MIDIETLRDRSTVVHGQCAGCGFEWPSPPWTSEINPVIVEFRGDEVVNFKFILCGECRKKLHKLLG
jgi:hypothetical protein